jgi:ABC-2 type transport system ATP-binding protein
MLSGHGFVIIVIGIAVLARVGYGIWRARRKRAAAGVDAAQVAARPPQTGIALAAGADVRPGRAEVPGARASVPAARASVPGGPAGDSVITAGGLVKSYGALTAVDDVSFDVAAGSVVALLGPNGAGKTTTMEILEGFRAPSGGSARVLGQDPRRGNRAWRARIGLVLQSTALDGQLTVAETVTAFARPCADPWPVAELLELVGLTDDARTRVGALSGGQRRRVDLAVGVAGRPELLFLDEPTTGLDPSARRDTWAVLQGLAAGGTTILLTTHYLEEAHELADRVIVLAGGRIVADATPAGLRAQAGGLTVRYRLPAGTTADGLPAELAGYLDAGGRVVVARSGEAPAVLQALLSWTREQQLDLDGLEVGTPSLEDAYLALTATTVSGTAGTGSGTAGTPGTPGTAGITSGTARTISGQEGTAS